MTRDFGRRGSRSPRANREGGPGPHSAEWSDLLFSLTETAEHLTPIERWNRILDSSVQ